jgi:glycosyltransferase involved in cell wall biosynthesis
VPPAAGFVSNRLDTLHGGLRRLAADPALAREMGQAAREHALRRYGLSRFLDDWQNLLEEVVDRMTTATVGRLQPAPLRGRTP